MIFASLRTLETPRLILRKFRPSDQQAHFQHITGDPEVAKGMLWEANPDPEHAGEVIRRIISRYGTRDGYRWVIARKGDDAYLGTLSLLRLEEEQGSCSFAYMMGRAFWNRGYMTEALRAVLEFAFVDLRAAYVEADHFADNPASGAVMAKAGMQYIETIPARYEKNGAVHDAVLYRITAEEWSRQQRGNC